MDGSELPATVRHAATVAVIRDGARGIEALLLRRTTRASFVGGAHVFPGGALDAADHSLGGRLLGEGGPWAAFVACALRECFEESGLLFSPTRVASDELTHWRAALHAGANLDSLLGEVRLDATDVVAWSRWVTPVGNPKRFDTRFFVAVAPPEQDPTPDGSEITECEWITPREAIRRADTGRMLLVTPTRSTLAALAGFTTAAEVITHARARRGPTPARSGGPPAARR